MPEMLYRKSIKEPTGEVIDGDQDAQDEKDFRTALAVTESE